MFTVTCYLATESILCSAIVLILSLVYFLFIGYPKLTKYAVTSKRFHSCYTFINSFIVSLSIKGSILSAFDYVKLNMDREYLDIADGLTTLNEEEKLEYLKKYFYFDIYKLFVSIVQIYLTQGGDIFNLSHYLINETRREEEYLTHSEAMCKSRSIDFAVLWIFTILILMILRFSLTQFYGYISKLLFYQLSIVGMYLLIIISIHLLIRKITQNFEGVRINV